MHWPRRPSRRRSRRTHSWVIGGSTPRCRQYAASLGTVQAENGKPRLAGLDRAMSINSRTWSPVMIGGRPRGLGGSSNVVPPHRLAARPAGPGARGRPVRRPAAAPPLRHSGAYPEPSTDVKLGLPPLRRPWILERADVEELPAGPADPRRQKRKGLTVEARRLAAANHLPSSPGVAITRSARMSPAALCGYLFATARNVARYVSARCGRAP
jgi:hypothetical protein